MKTQKLLSAGVLLVANALGLVAFLYPFFMPQAASQAQGMMAHAADAPLLFILLVFLCLVVVFSTFTQQHMTSKMVALLGILTALSAMLRALPGPGGFSGVFLLPVLAGYCYGPAFGFLLGSFSLMVSALIGGGVGPWLPYQMFSTGWMGMLSGFLPEFPGHRRWEAVMLAVWGALLGLLFGAVMNLWFWPFLSGGAGGTTTWQPGVHLWPALRNYLVFYVATSLWWDVGRAGGNALLLLLFGGAILRVLRRFRSRFRFDVLPEVVLLPDEAAAEPSEASLQLHRQ